MLQQLAFTDSNLNLIPTVNECDISCVSCIAGTEESTLDHTILCIAPKNIIAVTKMNLKIDPKIIIEDWERRQMPR